MSKRIEGIKKCDLWYLGGNFDTDLLMSINSAEDVPKFRYRCARSESLNLNDLRARFTVSRYRSGRFNDESRATVQLTYGLRQTQIDDINAMGKEIEAIAFYFSDSQNDGCAITISEQSDDIATSNWYDFTYEMPSGTNMDFPICCAIKFVGDDTPIVYERNWLLEIAELKDSDPKKPNGGLIGGVPYNFDDQTGKPWNSYPWRGNISFGWSVSGFYGNREQRSNLEVSHYLYKDRGDAIKAVKGEAVDPMDEEGEGGEDIRESDTEILYYNCDIYRSTSVSRSNPTRIESKKFTFKVQRYDENGDEIPTWRRSVFGIVGEMVGHYNVSFYNAEGIGGKVLECTEDGEIVTPKSITGKPVATWHETDKNVFYYFANVSTNMIVYDDYNKALNDIDRLRGGLDELDKTEYNGNTVEFDVGMSETYLLSSNEVKNLARIFNMNVTNEGEILDGMYLALSMHNNPIDVCIDLFALPVSCNGFVETTLQTIVFDIAGDD